MKLPDEILELIFVVLKMPTPAILGQHQHEHLGMEREHRGNEEREEREVNAGFLAETRVKLRTLASLARCSKRFERIARPLLYSGFPGEHVVSSQMFLSTVLARADLASGVQGLLLRETLHEDRRYPPRHCHGAWLDSIGHEPIYREIARFHSEVFLEGEMYIENVETYLFLLLCTEVTSIDLTASWIWDHLYMRELCDKLIAAQPSERTRMPLHKLRELSLRYAHSSAISYIELFEPLLRLPTIEALTIYRFTASGSNFLHQMPQLRKLCLWRCTVPADLVQKALEFLPNLVDLRMIWIARMSNDMTMQLNLSYMDFATAVCEHAKQLERLVLDVREPIGLSPVYYSGQYEEDTVDLSSHQCLREVTLERRAFWATPEEGGLARRLHTILPACLESLVVLANRWPSRHLEDYDLIAHNVLLLVAEAPPALRSIHIDGKIDVSAQDGVSNFDGHGQCLREAGWEGFEMMNDPMVLRASPVFRFTVTEPEQKRVLRGYTQFWAPGYVDLTTTLKRVGEDELSSERRAAWKDELKMRMDNRYQTMAAEEEMTAASAALQDT